VTRAAGSPRKCLSSCSERATVGWLALSLAVSHAWPSPRYLIYFCCIWVMTYAGNLSLRKVHLPLLYPCVRVRFFDIPIFPSPLFLVIVVHLLRRQRVAYESLGCWGTNGVGYQIRFQSSAALGPRSSSGGYGDRGGQQQRKPRLVFITEGLLLRQVLV